MVLLASNIWYIQRCILAFHFCRCCFLSLLTTYCFCDQTEHITDDVKLMDAKRAEKFKFAHMGTGAEDFQKMLLKSGASLSYTTKE